MYPYEYHKTNLIHVILALCREKISVLVFLRFGRQWTC